MPHSFAGTLHVAFAGTFPCDMQHRCCYMCSQRPVHLQPQFGYQAPSQNASHLLPESYQTCTMFNV